MHAALRHQLAVLKRSVPRPKIEDSDRMVWIMLRRMLKEWEEALILVKPHTVVRWHRKGFKYYWRRKSRSKPTIQRHLVHKRAAANGHCRKPLTHAESWSG